jgi:hypothetical protein
VTRPEADSSFPFSAEVNTAAVCLHGDVACGINLHTHTHTHTYRTPWPESVSELYRPSDCRLSAKLVPTLADRVCHMVSVTDPYGRILGFLDRTVDIVGARPRGWKWSPGRVKNFHPCISSRPALRFTQPLMQLALRVLSPGLKRQGREADHSPPTSAEGKKTRIYTSTPSFVFMA